jgi:hypothetical protein
MTRKIANLTIEILLIAILLPIAISQFMSVNTASWDANLATIWKLIPLLAILGIALGFITRLRAK